MAITKPELPPKAGYVEVEIEGKRVYRNAQTGEIYGNETRKPDPVGDLCGLTVEHEYRLTLLELGVPVDAV